MSKLKKQLTSAQIIILGFAAVILIGTLLLMLPFSTQDGHSPLFSDALFTATSAACVTGLVVHDTATYWSTFGQAVIILLIQIGGMGVVTFAVAIEIFSGKKISLKQRSTMQEAISAPKVGGIVRLTGFILKTTFLIELIASIIMAPTFCKEFGPLKGIWYSVFHSISAFCNAGFDLMGCETPYSSLTHFSNTPVINLTIMALIIIGGIGFLTWDDITINKLNIKRYRMQSKIIIMMTSFLILLPTLYFFFFEFSDTPVGERIWISLFQAVTPRTAGFNTTDLTMISEAGLALMIFLMLIGGSPGSTAGGMKTTTLAVMLSTSISVFRHNEDTQFFGRRITPDGVRNTITIATMYCTLFFSGGLIISRVEDLPLLTCLFETASAVGTVGLTLGITPQLGLLSHSILILLMYLGRVGGLTLIFAALSNRRVSPVKLPQEKLTVG
ncbi:MULTISPECIES: TrkH family potassium uptake protein [Lachnospiraceae]|uniref:TrkH family potassium uptake protein n=1 Tax=Lachnospiraceae TaxID=186803 RepID=UPI001F30AA1E|nr:potassium transporter TrkG [Faecalicatena contorta]MCF2668510.1 Trk family potassium uptake protein [Faecalicatena contorta]